ncbi:MAG: LysE family translocator [Mycobacterium leprae]
MLYYVVNGIVLGLAAGLTPGPLMALILTESLRGGWPAGFRVALAPLVTDSALLSLALVVAAPLPHWGISAISVIGGGIIMWMAFGAMRAEVPVLAVTEGAERGSFMRGITTNLLNPYAFIFWLTAGTSILKEAFRAFHWGGPALFLVPFFIVMIGVNLVVAYGVGRGRKFLQGAAYRWALRAAGILLLFMGAWRVWKGFQG